MIGEAELELSFTTLLCALKRVLKEVLGRAVWAIIIVLTTIIPVLCGQVMVPTSATTRPATTIADLTEILEIAEYQPTTRMVRKYKPKILAFRQIWLVASSVVLEARLAK